MHGFSPASTYPYVTVYVILKILVNFTQLPMVQVRNAQVNRSNNACAVLKDDTCQFLHLQKHFSLEVKGTLSAQTYVIA